MLEVRKLVKRFGGLVATNKLDLDVAHGETHALIGPNGAGKSTLIAQLQGELRPDEGKILFEGRDVTGEPAYRRARSGLGRSFQITSVFREFSVLENVVLSGRANDRHRFYFGRAAFSDPALTEPCLPILETVGLLGRKSSIARDLSHGELRQLELAMVLAMKPKLLLLDEPMAGMGRQDAASMTQLLKTLKKTYSILLVEHDMDAVFALADRITVLVGGRSIASGKPEEVRANSDVQSAYLGHG